MTEGKIVEWLKEPGAKVSRGESVLVVESDKADMDVESFQDGYLAAVLMPSGSTVPVGETIGLIVETEEEIASVQAENPVKSSVAASEASPPLETSVAREPSPAKTEELPPKKVVNASAPVQAVKHHGRIVVTPRAKKLASQLGVDLSTVAGTGPHGRIQAEDVQRSQGQPITVPWIAESNAPAMVPSSQPAALASSGPVANASKSAEVLEGKSFGSPGQTISFNTLQQAVNRNMEASLSVPCFRVGYSIATDKLDSFYKQVKPNGDTMTAYWLRRLGKHLHDTSRLMLRSLLKV